MKRILILVGASALFGVAVFVLSYFSRGLIEEHQDSVRMQRELDRVLAGTTTTNYSLVKREVEGDDAEERGIGRVMLSSPLMVFRQQQGEDISATEVIGYTNWERAQQSLPVLIQNEQLTKSAEAKVRDMFERQYFDHVGPTGEGPDVYVNAAHYEYVSIGENLALGNFGSAEDLVDAWMQSQGHRENVLRPRFQEIGIAVGDGIFEGKRVTIAVQHFGRPLSSCPDVDLALKDQIDELKLNMTGTQEAIDKERRRVRTLENEYDTLLLSYENTNQDNQSGTNTKQTLTQHDIEKIDQKRQQYEAAVKAYNKAVEQYNGYVRETKEKTNKYNVTIRAFNDCLQLQ